MAFEVGNVFVKTVYIGYEQAIGFSYMNRLFVYLCQLHGNSISSTVGNTIQAPRYGLIALL